MIKRDSKGRFVKGSTFHHSKEIKRKIGLGNSKPNPKVGKILSGLYKEGKIKINNMFKDGHKGYTFWKGKKFSEEHTKNLSLSHIGQTPYMKGKRHTKEAIEKIRQARVKQIFPIKDTKIEQKIQNYLKLLHIEFLTHYYISEITHSYQCDIFIPSMKLVIEADGCYWHGCPSCNKNLNEFQEKQIEEDEIRTKELIAKGFKIIRLWGHEIKNMDINKFTKILNREINL